MVVITKVEIREKIAEVKVTLTLERVKHIIDALEMKERDLKASINVWEKDIEDKEENKNREMIHEDYCRKLEEVSNIKKELKEGIKGCYTNTLRRLNG